MAAIQELRGSHRVTDDNPEAKFEALKNYGRDLTELAAAGKIDPVIGRDDEIRRFDAGSHPPHEKQPGADRRTGASARRPSPRASPSGSPTATCPESSSTGAWWPSTWGR